MATQAGTAADAQRIKLPGFGLPHDSWNVEDSCDDILDLSAVEGWQHDVLTIRERCMLFFINEITDKPDWFRKVHDEQILAKWKQEAQDVDWEKIGFMYGGMSDRMFEFCIAELRAKADVYEKTGIIAVLDATSCVLKSDTAISIELKNELRRAIGPLEAVPDHQRDWHPGSDEKVLDLVHPSLFPLVYGRTRVLPDHTIGISDCLASIAKGEIAPVPLALSPQSAPTSLWSTRFQWLPCNVKVTNGRDAKIQSYINNLHPVDHKPLYGVIEKIISQAIPFWNIVYQSHHSGDLRTAQRNGCSCVEYELPDGVDEEMPEDYEGDEDEYYEMVDNSRIYTLPEPEPFETLSITTEDIEKRSMFIGDGEKTIQVIVKLANIHLTPEKPDYEGGSWHIEGQLNEHIVSTAIYYYDNENLTDSRLAFRTKVEADSFSTELKYEQSDYTGIRKIFGVENDEANVQELGSVLTREDRLIVFPNGFQHRVGSFKLQDRTKPGHRKILALFLVAPSLPVISTANVPPQQRDWWLREVKSGESKVSDLPTELIDMIGEGVDNFPIGLEEAKKIREELMAERGKLDQKVDQAMADWNFSFCEH
ncbi:hypothetical protein BKA63DRAFT_161543 [Paraphoma chrysanthemicola]|nr:hypothetical protein BKA63DRAFT_161543 [Paraphoma chrysanthemicola]